MKSKFFFRRSILLSFLASTIIGVSLNRQAVNANAGSRDNIEGQRSALTSHKSSSGFMFINGETNPELISDNIAYSVVLRLLSSYKNNLERNQLTAYIKQVLKITDKDDIEVIFAIAQEYKNQMRFVEQQAEAIKEPYHPTHMPFIEADLTYLKKLDKTKEAIIENLLETASLRVNAGIMDIFRQTIQERVKYKVKVQQPNMSSSLHGVISTYSDLWADTESGAANEDLYICACAVGDLDPSSPSHKFYTQVRLTSPQGRITSALVYGDTPGLSVSAITPILMIWQPGDTGNYFTDAIYVSECPS